MKSEIGIPEAVGEEGWHVGELEMRLMDNF